MTRATILFAGPDRPGLVARLSGFFYERSLNILEASNYTDLYSGSAARFYMVAQVENGSDVVAVFAAVRDARARAVNASKWNSIESVMSVKKPARMKSGM